jgi:hypothetical protein
MFRFGAINSHIEFFIEQDTLRVILTMDQRLIVRHLTRKGLAAVATNKDLGATLGAEAINCHLITR